MNTYKNGNTIVGIDDDGTKIRYVPDNAPAEPLFPESIDLKISNRCDMNCPMCHERSVWNGGLADLQTHLLDDLHPFTELAIGGGDPMLHPELQKFLKEMKAKQVICNITVHWHSFLNNFKTLQRWANLNLIHGIGVSVNEEVPEDVVQKLSEIQNVVVHTIVGVASPETFRQLANKSLNILLLGYKNYGRGEEYKYSHPLGIKRYANWVKKNLNRFPEWFRAVSFDNLAIKQTDLENKLDPELFKQIYMGDDGTFTMYIDLVENKYAVSSTSKRFDIKSGSVTSLFQTVRMINKGLKKDD